VNLTNELETAKTIARVAAGICQNIQSELVDPSQKGGREPVTIADYASQALIGHALAENFPDDGVLSEERSEEFMLLLNDQQRALVQQFVTDAVGGYVFEEQVCAWLDFGKQQHDAERLWIVDPIDGTKGFLRRQHYCVAISLMIGGEPVLGVLASPGFYSDEENPPDDPGAFVDPVQATLLTSYESKHTDMSFLDSVAKALGRGPDAPKRGLDSQDKYGMVAAGMGDVYLRIVPEPDFREKLWDHAAGCVIVTEAGGRMTDIHGQPINWATGTRMVNNRGVLVSNRFLHDMLLEAIAKTGFE
jgi:3'(2'), 5'-bisphosphate nucleotidase